VKRLVILCALLVSAGCAPFHHPGSTPVRDEWDTTLSEARLDADSGRYDAADKALADFISLHNGSQEATEAIFWRGLFKVDPSNRNGSLSAGISSFDAYLASDSVNAHRSVAMVLRRTAALAQSLKVAATTATPQTTTVTPAPVVDKDATKSRDEEIASLREQLAKANAELERIKKRLANPKA
jgi:hypothetical protein